MRKYKEEKLMATKLPRVSIVPDVEQGLVNVELTKPSNINIGNPSAFPLAEDKFKNLSYQTASESIVKDKMARYYEIMNQIMAGEKTNLAELEALTVEIREYVLTDEDYNLMVGALQNMQTYVLKFLYTDINKKGQAIDKEVNKVIADINRFMEELEEAYSKSPSEYPIPNESVQLAKLESSVQKTLNNVEANYLVKISDSKPQDIGSALVWFNTGTKI